MEVETSLIKLLMELGYVATGQGLHTEAEVIFTGVRAARPKSEYPLIGLAITKMNAGEYEEAIRLLEEARELNPSNWLSASFLGLAFKLKGEQAKSRAILEEVLQNAQQKEAINMAQALLAEMS